MDRRTGDKIQIEGAYQYNAYYNGKKAIPLHYGTINVCGLGAWDLSNNGAGHGFV